jgi:hypothetical protein
MMDEITLAAGVREKLERQLLNAFDRPGLEGLARRLGLELDQIATGALGSVVGQFLGEVVRLGKLTALIKMARRANPTHPELNELLATLRPRVFKAPQVAELVRLLQDAKLPWELLEQQFLLSVPSSWDESSSKDAFQDAGARLEELVDVLSDFPDRDALGELLPLFEFVLRLCNTLGAGGAGGPLMEWLKSTALRLGKDPEDIKARGYRLLGELFLMVKLERVTAEGFQVTAWLADEKSRFPRVIFQEEQPRRLEEIPRALRKIWLQRELAEPLKQLGESKLTIEFLLPSELLFHPVEDWKIIPGAPIGTRYQVVVRSLERAYAEVRPPLEAELEDLPFALAPWNEKWRWFSSASEPPSRAVWVHQDADHRSTRFLADLVLPEVVCMALTMTPPALSEMTLRELIHHCLNNGMPMALWVRKPGCTSGKVQTLFHGLLKDLSQLPSAVRQARWEGFRSDEAEHLGKHLTLVWDAPCRLPTDARPGADLSAPGHVGVRG